MTRTQPAAKIFVTGDPGCGKTTAMRRVVERLASLPMSGFLTEEVRENGARTGFRGVTLDGKVFTLARAGAAGDFRVGPYGVMLEELEAVGVPALRPAPETRLVVVDEVGKMEAFSPGFREAITDLLAGSVAVLGTVAVHGVGFVKKVRHDPRVTLVRMTRASREAIVGDLLRRLQDAGVAQREERA
ncbi:MAG TPA: nucleoside-triphosphatase [Candidatus Polarisedimenticolaceae bacterium]|nr:nucleoside-triphosphatase [Candidatus Polarisedimenticolaceae bacterium]